MRRVFCAKNLSMGSLLRLKGVWGASFGLLLLACSEAPKGSSGSGGSSSGGDTASGGQVSQGGSTSTTEGGTEASSGGSVSKGGASAVAKGGATSQGGKASGGQATTGEAGAPGTEPGLELCNGSADTGARASSADFSVNTDTGEHDAHLLLMNRGSLIRRVQMYQTSGQADHQHNVHFTDDELVELLAGTTVTVTTHGPPLNAAEGHVHTITVRPCPGATTP